MRNQTGLERRVWIIEVRTALCYLLGRALLDEVVRVFEAGLFMVGGDEVPYDCWASNPGVRAFVERKGSVSTSHKHLPITYYCTLALVAVACASKGNAIPSPSHTVGANQSGEWLLYF